MRGSGQPGPGGRSGVAPATIPTAPTEPAAGLRRNYLSLPEVVAQSIGTVAPSGTPALVLATVFASAGNGTWLAYGFATVALLCVSWCINQFARRTASPGALYIFAGKGLGLALGALAGWALLIAYLFTAASVIGGAASYLLVLVHETTGFLGGRPSAILLSVAVIGLAWGLGYQDIRLSTRTTLLIEFSTVALILVVVLGSLFLKGPAVDHDQLTLASVTPGHLWLGLVLAFFSFVGFESATALGTEARRPFTVIPRAVILSVISTGIIFMICAYGLVGAFQGVDPGLDKAEAPLAVVAAGLGIGTVGTLISAGVALSFFACTLGSVNAGARVLYQLSRQGMVPPLAGRAHHAFGTPHVAVSLLAVLALALSLGLTAGGVDLVDGFGYLGTLATFGFLFAYILVAVAAPAYLRRIGALRAHHLAIAAVTVVLLAIPLIGSVYPVPDWPVSILPYLFLALIAAGMAQFLTVRLRTPELLAAFDAEHLAEAPAAEAGRQA